MPQGKVESVPQDGLTTRQRRNQPVLAVHTGPGKGKSTAAFGMAMRAWNQGFDIGVFQFVKSAKWKVGEESVFRTLGDLHTDTGAGGAVKVGSIGSGDASLGGLLGKLLDRVQGVLVLPGHGADLAGFGEPLGDEGRQHELGGGHPGLGDHATHGRGGAQTTRPHQGTQHLGQGFDGGVSHESLPGLR